MKLPLTPFPVLLTFACVAVLGATHHCYAQSAYPFVPHDFDVPQKLEAEDFRLRMLTVSDVVKDYDAVMSSAAYIKELWNGVSWPTGLTLEQNLIDLGWHQKEFQRRRSFAFTVTDPGDRRVLGCVYINPTRKVGYDAVVYLWTRPKDQTELITPDSLRDAVRTWLEASWPFDSPAFPGADMSWDEWAALEEVPR